MRRADWELLSVHLFKDSVALTFFDQAVMSNRLCGRYSEAEQGQDKHPDDRNVVRLRRNGYHMLHVTPPFNRDSSTLTRGGKSFVGAVRWGM